MQQSVSAEVASALWLVYYLNWAPPYTELKKQVSR